MSTLSMTGFGRGVAEAGGLRAEAEVSSVNRKQFDCSVSLPPGLSRFEENCRRIVASSMTRGRVQLVVKAEAPSAADAVDMDFVGRRIASLRAVADAFGIKGDLSLSDLARMPDFVSAVSAFPNPDAAWPAVETAVRAAVSSHRAMREREGLALRSDLEQRIARLRALRA
ncbi:MAG: hypothetical protein IJS46_06785, partial [Kiritimatiellae bacterium]|nr:hypothetical protein [Kiritimatiellia bacterium]